MTIQIPGSLMGVSHLVGYEWVDSDEDALFRIGDYWHAGADEVRGLIPSLNWIRRQLPSVLRGVSADVADEQFALLFDGDASVEILADAMAALGDLARGTGKKVEYTKLQILSALAIAAFEIAWARAQIPVTAGTSAAAIPVIKGITAATIRQTESLLLKQITLDLGNTMRRTMVQRIVKKASVESGAAMGQELAIQEVQHSNGHQLAHDWNKVGMAAVTNLAGGAAQGTVSDVGKRLLGESMFRGAAVGYSAGMGKEVVGSLVTGQPVDLVAVLGSASTAATGAVRGGAAARKAARAAADTAADSE